MNVSEVVARFLRERGVERVYVLPGGIISPLIDALSQKDGIALVTVHHEQGAAFAADGEARVTGRPGVALATVGPGALNLLSGIASAHFDSVPALFFVGQVQSYLRRDRRGTRQFGFQEVDVAAMAAPIAKAVLALKSAAEVPAALEDAWQIALEGRPGPVVIELPVDVQSAPLDAPAPSEARAIERAQPDAAAVDDALAKMAAAERPIVLAGGGVRAANARDLARRLVERTGALYAATLMSLDVLPTGDPRHVGLVGMYGRRSANLTLRESDLVLVLGSRLDPGITSADTSDWRRGKTIVQIDCDPAEMKRVRGVTPILCDVRAFLEAALARLPADGARSRAGWQDRAAALRREHPDDQELAGEDGIDPNRFMHALSRAGNTAVAAYVVDAGQHTWWAAQSLDLDDQRFIAASGLGAMGFSLPAGIGVACATRRPVVVIVGDGALQINLQELQTIVRNDLPVKIVVVNNRCHGMVRQFQEGAFDGRYPTTLWGYDTPDFARVAGAFGIAARAVSDPSDVAEATRWLFEEPARPALLELRLSPHLNVYPNVPFGSPITAMSSSPRRRA